MQPNDQHFTPASVDDQIDRALATPNNMAPEGRLIRDLHTHLASGAEEVTALDRIWRRVQAEHPAASTAPHAETSPVASHPHKGSVITMQHTDIPPTHSVPNIPIAHNEPRRRTWLGAVAAILVVVLGAAVFALRAPQHGTPGRSSTTGTGTPTVAAIPTTWKHETALDYRAPYVTTVPAIAPSDPNVIYEAYRSPTDNSATNYRRTDDGGKTWHELTFPVPNNTGHTYFTSYVSPLDPKTVFLQIFEGTGTACPKEVQTTVGSESGNPFCAIQYISTDAGAHWQLQHLPANGTFTDSILASQQYLRLQGTRLYATIQCYGTDCDGIITSTDGGKTWSIISAAVRAGGNAICDVAAAPIGTTIFALASTDCNSNTSKHAPLHLWQSADAGTTWHDGGILPSTFTLGMAVTDGSDSAHSLVYSDIPAVAQETTNKMGGDFTTWTTAPNDIKVTADGGKTWTNAPTAGIPAMMNVQRLVGSLQDGSVLIECAPAPNSITNGDYDFKGSTYFYWKQGDASWHQLGDTTIGNLIGLIVTPDATAIGKVWLLTVDRTHQHDGSMAAAVYSI